MADHQNKTQDENGLTPVIGDTRIFQDVANTLSDATGRTITHDAIPHDAFVAGVVVSGAPDDDVWITDYAYDVAATGVWGRMA